MRSSLFFVLAGLMTPLFANAECGHAPQQGQFIGKVLKVDQSNGVCKVFVGHFEIYNESMICPLSAKAATEIALTGPCSLKVGDEASGVISVDNKGVATWEQ